MSLTAPFFHDIAEGPATAQAVWYALPDGVRLRIALWQGTNTGTDTGTDTRSDTGTDKGTGKGTVFILPGRTEFVEKYGGMAARFAQIGLSAISIDWRGQGLSDRLLADKRMGHVDQFPDYQSDVAAMLAAAQDADLPKPYFLLGHSMGAAIGLRALVEGFPARAAVFSSPMWGIGVSAPMRPVAWAYSWGAALLGQSHRLTPGTSRNTYLIAEPFEGNSLTTDPEMFAFMRNQVVQHPELELAGPSLNWLLASLKECCFLSRVAPPSVPTLVLAAGAEKIVQTAAIPKRVQTWPQAQLVEVAGAEHEVFMEAPEIREFAYQQVLAHFTAHL